MTVYEFADIELDEALYQLRRGGAVVKLEPKVFDVLAYLVRNRERVVSKDELLGALWPGEHVSDSVLPRCVTAARKAVGDSATAQRIIATVHGRGYRFVASVAAPEASPGVAAERPRSDAAAGTGGPPFVGRDDAMAQLRRALHSALHGHGRLVLLVGEPGIGKTRTADEIAAEAGRWGARVLAGRCYEGDGAPAFWPWVQIVRAAAALPDAREARACIGSGAADLAQLLPDAGAPARPPSSSPRHPARVPTADTAAGAVLASEQARFRLFDSVTGFLAALATSRPLVIVLDDLHWADKPSLLLVQFLAREMRDVPLLVVATYRDVELRRDHPLAATLGELGRVPTCERVALRGLTEDDVAGFVAAATGRAPSAAATQAICAMTEGNPFFVGEVVRLLASRGDLAGDPSTWTQTLPQGVREAIGRRLNALSEDCNRVLALASVLGREFRVAELRELAELDAARLLELLEEAADARIVAPADGGAAAAAPTRYAFAHALIRETLYEELTLPVRVRLHRRAGEVVERLRATERGTYAAELAHHFYQAAPGGDAEKAIAYALRAAEGALESLAYEEAAQHHERALETLELVGGAEDARRCELLLGLGDARLRARERDASRATFRRAGEVARAAGRSDLLARAALGFGGRAEFGVGPDPEMRALLDEALAALSADAVALRARILSRMVGTSPYAETMATRRALSEEAVTLARRTGDPATLADALAAQHWALLGPDHVPARLAVADEMRAVAEAGGERAWAFLAHDFRFGAYLALGDVTAADRELDALRLVAAELRQPIEQWFVTWFRASRAIGDGRFAEGEAFIRESLAIGERAQHPAAVSSFRGQLLWLRAEQGRHEDMAEVEESLRLLLPAVTGARAILETALVNLYVDQGRIDDARRAFDAVTAHDLRDVERDEHWMVTMAMAAEAVAGLGDARRAPIVHDLLRPFAERNVVHDLIRGYRGSVALYLALAATAMREWDAAAGHFDEARQANLRMGTRPYVARTEFEHARMLLARGRRTDRPRARTLLAGANAIARELGMHRLEAKIAASAVPR